MRICTQAFHVPKHGNAESEYEDAFFPVNTVHGERAQFRCAVADGATESAFAREWAQLLVRGFGRGRLNLKRLQKAWHRLITGKPLPWYLEAKIVHGAHCAFVGLAMHGRSPRADGGRWRALAVGDSCLFQVRDNMLVAAGPLWRSEDFDNRPFLVSTKGPAAISRGAPHLTLLSGEWQVGDGFYLATDAFAQWILAEHEAGRPPWGLLRALGTDQEGVAFNALVEKLRADRRLTNDDTTLLRAEVV